MTKLSRQQSSLDPLQTRVVPSSFLDQLEDSTTKPDEKRNANGMFPVDLLCALHGTGVLRPGDCAA